MVEKRIYGAPGTGKTTRLSQWIRQLVGDGDYSPKDVVATSFTRAAAIELAGRKTGLPDHNIGTIHSICYHALDYPRIIEVDKALLKEWNRRYAWKWPVASAAGRQALDEPPAHLSPLQDWNVTRARRPKARASQPFALAWEQFKERYGAVDFTDLLLQAPRSVGAKALFVDEAQDLSPLQWEVVRRWGAAADLFVTAGDDDQALYSFLGTDLRAWLEPLPSAAKEVLGHSYRLPRTVYERAERWIRRLGHAREAKSYSPRDAEGECRCRSFRYAHPEALVREVRDRAAENGHTTALLASCNYMLAPVIEELRSAGVPYHNPYRPQRGDWNPLGSTGQRILDFLDCCRKVNAGTPVSADCWWHWIEMLRAKDVLRRSAKAWLKARAVGPTQMITPGVSEVDIVEHIATLPLLQAMQRQDVSWLRRNATKRFQKALEYPVTIYNDLGEKGLREEPRVIVGTIHSTKGGEADYVYLSPDISYAADKQRIVSMSGMEAVTRMFYVGMTRARETLYLGESNGKFSVNW